MIETTWPKVGIDRMSDGRFRAYFRGGPGLATVTSCHSHDLPTLVQWVRNMCKDYGAKLPEEFAPVPDYVVKALEAAEAVESALDSSAGNINPERGVL
jgi:hypothetical protein